MALIRDRVRTGPPLYWTVTAGANGQLNAAYLASNPEFLDDPGNFIGLPQPIVDDVRKAIAARTQAATRRGGAVNRPLECCYRHTEGQAVRRFRARRLARTSLTASTNSWMDAEGSAIGKAIGDVIRE